VLRQSAGLPASGVIDRVLAAIDAFAAGAPQFDDITLLVARRTS
jgi:serine phosphatase RsbU (regulator of sigma subunit)